LQRQLQSRWQARQNSGGKKATSPLGLHAYSPKNESRALKRLGRLCSERLALYSDSYDSDLKLLSGDLTPNERNCILLRASEKRVHIHDLP
jgi:hypothetical protein